MIAIAQAAFRQPNRVSDFGLVILVSLGGLVLALAAANFGFDISAGM